MTDLDFTSVSYESQEQQTSWHGIVMEDGDEFDAFMKNDVASRLHDEEGGAEFEAHLRSLANTGFAQDSLDAILAAEVPEERDWAVGEAMAEAFLASEHGIIWPWNMERDKRNPKASLPGADLVGFKVKDGETQLALGEVKTSADANTPPGVMNGRSGMAHQIDNLSNDLSLISQLLKWLLPRCKGTEHEASFNEAVGLFLNSGNKAVALFGVLIRDTEPAELDLQARGQHIAEHLEDPTTCCLIAIYLPCIISDLPTRVAGGES